MTGPTCLCVVASQNETNELLAEAAMNVPLLASAIHFCIVATVNSPLRERGPGGHVRHLTWIEASTRIRPF